MEDKLMAAEIKIDTDLVHIDIQNDPIKTSGGERIDHEVLQAQAKQAVDCLAPVDYQQTRGTCPDERPRVGLRSGEAFVEPRPSVWGGPEIYALGIGELTGFFGVGNSSGKDRLHAVDRELEAAGMRRGGHENCAANGSFGAWIDSIADSPEDKVTYARNQLGERFDQRAADEVVGCAREVQASGRYDGWSEAVLPEVLGDESGQAIEKLADVPHEGNTLVRVHIDGYTVDQTPLYDRSIVGKGSFVFDDPYADRIEHIMTSGPDAAWKKVVAEHAREMMTAAIAGAVPNEEIYQITLSAR